MTTPKTQFPVVPAESFTPGPKREPESGVAPRAPRLPSTAHVGLLFLVLTLVGFVALGAALPRYTLSSTARHGLTYDTLFAELHDALVDEPDRPLRRAIRAVQVDALRAALEIERQRVEEWKAVADRWALKAERLSEPRCERLDLA